MRLFARLLAVVALTSWADIAQGFEIELEVGLLNRFTVTRAEVESLLRYTGSANPRSLQRGYHARIRRKSS